MAETRKRTAAVGQRVLDTADEAEDTEQGPSDNYALRMSQALEAISAAQSGRGFGAALAARAVVAEPEPVAAPSGPSAPKKAPKRATGVRRSTAASASAVKASTSVTAPSARRAYARRDIVEDEVPSVLLGEPSRAPEVVAPAAQPSQPAPEAPEVDDEWLAEAMDNNARFAAALNATPAPADSARQDETLPSAAQPAGSAANGLARDGGIKAFLAALDRLPPIRLPLGPPIPWKLGLPTLAALVVLMGVMSRSAGGPDAQGVALPAQQTYAVQQEAPLFTDSAQAQPQAQPAAAPVGVQEPAATSGLNVFDLGIKLAAVLGLAYGSLVLLKKVGMGGGSSARGTAGGAGLTVVSSLVLAPNRTVHLLSVPGGKTLLVGVTPNQVNLIAELGEVQAEHATADGVSFLDVLSSKLTK